MCQNEPYNFSHILFISRTYRLSPEEEAAMQSAAHPAKRQKVPSVSGSGPSDGVYSFHPEDEYIQKASLILKFVELFVVLTILHQVASHTLDYSFSSAEPREKDSFGLDTGGRMMLVPADRFQELIASLNEAYTVPS
jgi:protein BCP1